MGYGKQGQGHFAFHPFTLMGGLPEAIRIFGGDQNLDALLESLNVEVFGSGEPMTAAAPQPGTRPS
jgi:type I restriction enzyme R subunit